MKDDPHLPHHELQDVAPTVLHHPEEDETILARWLRRGIEKGPMFWLLAAGVAVVVVALMFLVGGLAAGKQMTHEGWADLMLAKGPDEIVPIADAEEQTPVGPWAALQAAEGRYLEGFENLPEKRDVAGPLLNRAYEMFDQAYREAPADSPVRRFAAMGKARSLEARNELDKAIEQYKEVAREFAGTPEAARADEAARRLARPESREFYEKLYAYKPRELNLPPGGSGLLNGLGSGLPDLGLPPGHPALDGPTIPARPSLPPAIEPGAGPGSVPAPSPALPPIVPPTEAPATSPAANPAPEPKVGGGPELPGGVFQNNPPPAPVPAPESKPEPRGELPETPFAGGEPKG